MTIVILYLLKKFTLGKWDAENRNPYRDETLGLPPGLLRGVLTLSVLFVVMILQISTLYVKPIDISILNGLFSSGELAKNEALDNILGKLLIPEERFANLMTAFQMIIAFYFGGKAFQTVTKAETDVAEKQTAASAQLEEKRMQYAAGQIYEDEDAMG